MDTNPSACLGGTATGEGGRVAVEAQVAHEVLAFASFPGTSDGGGRVRLLSTAQGAAKAKAVASGCRVAAFVVLAFATPIACSHHDASRARGGPRVQGAPNSFLVKASPQSGDGKTVVVDEAIFTGVQGYIAIHSNGGGAPGPTIGVSNLLPAGVSNHVKVTLKPPLATSATVFAVLHVEDDHNATYDFPRGDAPATLDGRVVVVPIPMTVTK